MADELYRQSDTFRCAVASCATFLQENYGFDLLQHFDMEQGWGDPVSSSVGLTAIQVGLVDLLVKDYGIKPAGIIGHSAGACDRTSSFVHLIALDCWNIRRSGLLLIRTCLGSSIDPTL